MFKTASDLIALESAYLAKIFSEEPEHLANLISKKPDVFADLLKEEEVVLDYIFDNKPKLKNIVASNPELKKHFK